MSGLIAIAISGLNAAQAGLVTTGHNISNASTPGFHRQEVQQSNATPQFTGAGFIGTGVQVDTIKRVYSDFLDGQVNRAQARSNYFSTYSGQIGQIDEILGDPSIGLAPALESFFASVHNAASNPASVPARQDMLSTGASLTGRVQVLDERFIEMNRGINEQIQSTISGVNAYAREIAALSGRIAGARADPRQEPNDLLDKRGQLISELNSLIGAQATVQPDGNVTVTVGNGQSLVVGTRSFELAAVNSPEVPDQMNVAYLAGGTPITLSETTLSSGSLGALLAFRAGPLTDAQNQLGRIAAGLAQSFNAQHRLGQDLTGSMGGDFFSVPQAGVTANLLNTGSATLSASITSASALTASNYRVSYTGGAYQVTRLSDATTTSYAALPQTVDGVSIQLTGGTPANGDTFFIEPTRYTARNLNVVLTNPSAIAAAAPIRTSAASANTGTGTINPGSVNAPLNANVQQPVSIVFTSATTFNVTGTGTGNPVGVPYTPGAPITYNGWTVNVSGTVSAGDTFTVAPNTNAVSDNRNASLLANLQVANTLSGGTASYQSSYAQLTSFVGNTTRDMKLAADAEDAIAVRSRETQQSMSGVNLDEEAANLLRYQQAYQAAGKVVQVASTLFDTILSIRA
jgi:flagellar hook-associated protein 1 FlgK